MSTSSPAASVRGVSHPRVLVVLTLVVGLVASGAATWAVQAATDRAVDDRFGRTANDVAAAVEGRLTEVESAVLATGGLVDASTRVTAEELDRFTDSLTRGQDLPARFPGLTALAVSGTGGAAALTAPSDPRTRAAVETILRHPSLAGPLHRATASAIPVVHALPDGEGAAELGVLAAHYRDPAVTQPGTMTSEREDALAGWTLALLDVDGLLGGVLPRGSNGLSATLLDESGVDLGTTGYPSADGHRTATVAIPGTTLQLTVTAGGSLVHTAEHRLPELVLFTGVLLTLAVAAMVWLLATQRSRALTRVEAATDELARANGELEESNERLREFAGTVAHDLRGPLTTVHGMVATLARRLGDDLEPVDTELLAAAQRGTSHMDELIVDVLRYAEAGVAPTDLVELELSAVVDEVLERVAASRRPGDVVEVDATDHVVADPTGLRRVLGNLVGNSLKYAREDGTVHVLLSSHRRGDRVVIEVADDGPGIPPELREDLTTAFRRGDTSEEGTGLGLAICTRIVTNHGGRLLLGDSRLGGALVRFDLPAA